MNLILCCVIHFPLHRFEEHVLAHFEGEDNLEDSNPLDDPTGPWGPQFRAARLLQID